LATRVILPKVPVTADVNLFDGERVSGEFFVAAKSPVHGGEETLLELLNDNARSFVPFQTEHGLMLLNRATVRSVQFDSPDLMSVFTSPDNDNIYGMTVYWRTETQTDAEVQGFCYTGALDEKGRRPVDLLNSPEMFLLLFSNDRMILFNKHAISHATV